MVETWREGPCNVAGGWQCRGSGERWFGAHVGSGSLGLCESFLNKGGEFEADLRARNEEKSSQVAFENEVKGETECSKIG